MNLRTKAQRLVLFVLVLCIVEAVFAADVDNPPAGPSPCTSEQFYCGEDSEPQCIAISQICDNIKHCRNGKDEANCLHACPLNTYMCKDGGCISLEYRCNGQYECLDGSDEQDCDDLPNTVCAPPGNFYCQADDKCIPVGLRCNGQKDCDSGEDEKGCPRNKCSEKGSFACGDTGHCISEWRVCDGNDDCPQGTDERDCANQLPNVDDYFDAGACKPGEFQCLDGVCIPQNKVCDNVPHCKGGEDEGGLCGSCLDYGCGVKCTDYPTGPKCSCPSEMTLSIDEKSCNRQDLCQNDGKRCAHYCIQEDGQPKCTCSSGYELVGSDCQVGEQHRNGDLLFVNEDRTVRKSNLFKESGSLYEEFVSDLPSSFNQITSLAFDQHNQNLYYVAQKESQHTGSIFRKAKGSQSSELFEGHGLKRVAYDWIADKLYYASTGLGIGVCSSDGRYCSHLVVAPRHVQGELICDYGNLIVHPKRGLLIWLEYNSDHPNGVVMAAGMDGSKPRIVYSKGAKRVLGISIDYATDKLYISEGRQRLVAIDLNSMRREVVAINGLPGSMIAFGGSFYFVSRDSNFLVRSRDVGDSEFIHQVRGKQFPVSINNALYYESFDNPCQSLDCSHMCVLVESSASAFPSAKCICPDQYLKVNRGSCEFSPRAEAPVKTSREFLDVLCQQDEACYGRGHCQELHGEGTLVSRCSCDDDSKGLYCELKLGRVEPERKRWLKWVFLLLSMFLGFPLLVVVAVCCLRQYPDLALPVANAVNSASERFNSAIKSQSRMASPNSTRTLLKKSDLSPRAAVVNIPHAYSNPAFGTENLEDEKLPEGDNGSVGVSPLTFNGFARPSF